MPLSKKKNNNNITVSFVDSPSANDVTGSCIYVKTPNHNILLECGLHQTNDKYQDYLVNNRKTKEFKPRDIDLIFVLHNHGDHSLLVPKLFKNGCEAGVVMPELNKSVYEKMLIDSAHISERDIFVINEQHNKIQHQIGTYHDRDIVICKNGKCQCNTIQPTFPFFH